MGTRADFYRLGRVARALLLCVACSAVWLGAGSTPRCEEPAPPAALEKPRLVIENREVDLGQLVRGQVVNGRFALRNAGDSVLRITSAKPG